MTKGKGKNPGAGGLKKHLNLKAHKERKQPSERRHLGSLEKHQDYVQRARLHHRKEHQIQKLRKKAAERNPEEFDFGMIRGRADAKGRHVANAHERRTTKEQREINAHDLRFLDWRRRQLQRQTEKDVDSLDFVAREREHTHVRFVDGDEEVPVPAQPPAVDDDDDDDEEGVDGSTPAAQRMLDRMEMQARIERAAEGLRLEQNLISKGRRRLIDTPDGQRYCWATQRRR